MTNAEKSDLKQVLKKLPAGERVFLYHKPATIRAYAKAFEIKVKLSKCTTSSAFVTRMKGIK